MCVMWSMSGPVHGLRCTRMTPRRRSNLHNRSAAQGFDILETDRTHKLTTIVCREKQTG